MISDINNYNKKPSCR